MATKTKKKTPEEEAITIDIFKSRLVPKSRILSEEEAAKFLERFNVTKQQIPRILAADPVCRLLKTKGGDIIEFDRTNKTAGLSKYYRVVIGGA